MKLLNIIKWTCVWTSTWTLLMSPVAMGQEAKKVSKTQMQTALNDLGLNKQITMGEFYNKNKYMLPERISKHIGPLFLNNKNVMMPQFEVISSKTTSGEEITAVRVSNGNELINMQWFNQPERMMKFQNTNLSHDDIVNFDDMLTRITYGDEKYYKQIENQKTKFKVTSKTKYPNITKAEWKSMSAYDRANYIVNMRLLWQDAKSILDIKNTKNNKTSLHLFEKNNPFFMVLMGQEAIAADKKSKSVMSNNSSFSGKSCIVAGYTSSYQRGSEGVEVCDHNLIDKEYNDKDNSLYIDAKKYCSATSQIACNPYVYGTPKGAPTCVTPSRSNDDFQKATHWDGPCDSPSRLQNSNSEIQILKDVKSQGRYDEDNLLSKKEREEKFKAAQVSDDAKDNFQKTEEYLMGILKFRKLVKSDAKSLFTDDVMSNDVLVAVQAAKVAFDSQIDKALSSCKAESDTTKNKKVVHEKNYWQACDQLHRRFTFVNELFESKCESKKINPVTLKCSCAQPATNEVLPGAKCAVVNPTPVAPPVIAEPVITPPAPPVVDIDCESKYPGASGMSKTCMCATGKMPQKAVIDDPSGAETYSCDSAVAVAKPKKDKESDCGFICKAWNFIKMPLLFLTAAVGGYFLLKNYLLRRLGKNRF